LHADESVWVLRRVHEGHTVLAAFNLGQQGVVQGLDHAPRPGGDALALNGATLQGTQLHLPPGSAFILPL
jgi:hypothetical protein